MSSGNHKFFPTTPTESRINNRVIKRLIVLDLRFLERECPSIVLLHERKDNNKLADQNRQFHKPNSRNYTRSTIIKTKKSKPLYKLIIYHKIPSSIFFHFLSNKTYKYKANKIFLFLYQIEIITGFQPAST